MEPPGLEGTGRPRRVRCSQWVVEALAYHFGVASHVDNEVVVLATGLDQYLHEVFQHVDSGGRGAISADDFRFLCEVLDLGETRAEGRGTWESPLLRDLPPTLSFQEFYGRLCGPFEDVGSQSGNDPRRAPCAPHSGDPELLEAQIQLRSRRTRTREPITHRGWSSSPSGIHSDRTDGESCRCRGSRISCASSLFASSSQSAARRTCDARNLRNSCCCCCRYCSRENVCSKVPAVVLEQMQQRLARLEEENTNLRELVEDLRLALQGSDARALALQVTLRRLAAAPRQVRRAERVRVQDSQSGSERVRWQRLCEMRNSALRSEAHAVRCGAERTRCVLQAALARVHDLECKVRQAFHERCAKSGRTESAATASSSSTLENNSKHNGVSHNQRPPPVGGSETPTSAGRDGGCGIIGVQMLTATECQAASHEEEQQKLETRDIDLYIRSGGLRALNWPCSDVQLKHNLTMEMKEWLASAEQLQAELQAVEAERVRLSLLEEKLGDLLCLLLRLHTLNIPYQFLGKVIVETLNCFEELCNDNVRAMKITEILDTLYYHLASCDVVLTRQLNSMISAPQPATKSLIIHC
uniref:EF-hand and coiled-coil domain-containing protein 1 n=1 Tax=Myxine glutinosa TaxID=7769 RepID=UPI00358E9935